MLICSYPAENKILVAWKTGIMASGSERIIEYYKILVSGVRCQKGESLNPET